MKPPKEYVKMLQWFAPEVEEDIPPGQDKISYGMSHLNELERRTVMDFIVHILQQDLTDQELAEVWDEGGPRIALVDIKDYRKAFEKIRGRLADSFKS